MTDTFKHALNVQKTADSYRFCIDYRNLNECTQAASWPLPNIQGMFERIGHYKPDTFGVMDLTSGYHQAPLDEASKKKFRKKLFAFMVYSNLPGSRLALVESPLTSKSRWRQ